MRNAVSAFFRSVMSWTRTNSADLPAKVNRFDSRVRKKIVFETLQIFRRTDVLDRHIKEFRARIAVMAHGGGVHGQKAKRGEIVNPHWLRVRFEEQAILRFRLSQRLFNPSRDGHIENE